MNHYEQDVAVFVHSSTVSFVDRFCLVFSNATLSIGRCRAIENYLIAIVIVFGNFVSGLRNQIMQYSILSRQLGALKKFF